MIVDHNKIQSDTWVHEVSPLGDLVGKLRAFGWHVARCDGHDVDALERVFREFDGVPDRPKVLIADTIKGRGVSFMEGPAAMQASELYLYHSGAPGERRTRPAWRSCSPPPTRSSPSSASARSPPSRASATRAASRARPTIWWGPTRRRWWRSASGAPTCWPSTPI